MQASFLQGFILNLALSVYFGRVYIYAESRQCYLQFSTRYQKFLEGTFAAN